jgi:peptidoglycan hydrolase-like protein with peptidoglycan-binding domain
MSEPEATAPARQQEPEPERTQEQQHEEAQASKRRGRRVFRVLVGGIVVVAVGGAGAVYAAQDEGGTKTPKTSTLPTAQVVRTDMVNTTEVDGTLGYTGSRPVLAEGGGRITALPAVGAVIRRGDRVYGKDGHDVPLFIGTTPFWRELKVGMTRGYDVLELERNLTSLGYGDYLSVDRTFTTSTARAVKEWQDDLNVTESGVVKPGDVVMQTGEIRVTKISAVLGTPAAGEVLTASGTERRITVDLPVSDQNMAKKGAKVKVTLPGGKTTTGRVSSIGKVASAGDTNAQSQTGEGTQNATIPIYITLDNKKSAGDLDGAPATVGFTSTEHKNVLAVPVNALLASADGSYEVNVVTAAGTVRGVPVKLGIFEGDNVEVTGNLTPGMKVQVPKS